jgi:hypothetical protein
MQDLVQKINVLCDNAISCVDLSDFLSLHSSSIPDLITYLKSNIISGELNEELECTLSRRAEALRTFRYILRHFEVDGIRAECLR